MNFVIEQCDATGEIRFSGSLTVMEIQRLNLDRLDRAVLHQSLKDSPASDYLLTLELIYRRHEEQQKKDTTA